MNWPGVHALVRDAQAGCPLAWGRLDGFVRPFLARAARSRYRFAPDATARDLVQDTLRAAVRRLGRFRGGSDDADTGAKLRKWLLRVLHRAYLNGVRAGNARSRKPPGRRAQAGPDLPDGGRTPGTLAAAADDARRVADALAKLPADDRRLVERLVFHGATLAEAAAEFGLTVSQVRTRRDALLRRLRDELA